MISLFPRRKAAVLRMTESVSSNILWCVHIEQVHSWCSWENWLQPFTDLPCFPARSVASWSVLLRPSRGLNWGAELTLTALQNGEEFKIHVRKDSLLFFLFLLGFFFFPLVSLLSYIFHHKFRHGKQIIFERSMSWLEKIGCEWDYFCLGVQIWLIKKMLAPRSTSFPALYMCLFLFKDGCEETVSIERWWGNFLGVELLWWWFR